MPHLALRYEPNAFQTTGEKLMGRQAAGQGFLGGLLQHGRLESLTAVVTSKAGAQGFLDAVRGARPGLAASATDQTDLAALARAGTYFHPEPLPAAAAWARQLAHPAAWSLCGVTHTISSAGALDMIAGWPTAPLHPWDAVVCTSAAVKASVMRLLNAQTDYLRSRLGASQFPLPQLPVIPLGVDCEALARRPDQIMAARKALDLSPETVVVLFLGRLSWHAKANPAPMYMALQRCARDRPVALIECGWHANDFIRDGFAEAAQALMPSVRRIVLDGRETGKRTQAWCAADIFCSLSDNIQETFGLTPVEAMAAGLPCVVTDWNGYRDTVRDGIDGFLIPTLAPAPGAGGDLAAGHALGADTYDVYLSRAQLSVSVDIAAAGVALERLCSDAALRARMGEAAQARAANDFDWRHIVRRYEALWAELAQIRTQPSAKSVMTGWPARMDPFALFDSYPSQTVSPGDRVGPMPGLSEADVQARLTLRIARQAGALTASPDDLMALWRALGEGTPHKLAPETSQPGGAKALRGLTTLIKLGLAVRLTGS